MDYLGYTRHRPWPLPSRPWIMTQVWNHLLFAHWPLPPEALRPLVPRELPLDTFDGQAWVGVVPFYISGSRTRLLPPLPTLAAFSELNLRTYVTVNGKPGVYFFSLDAASLPAVIGARIGFLLPYFYARIRFTVREGTFRYTHRRLGPGRIPAAFEGTYAPAGPAYEPVRGTLDHWLTERYCLYTVALGRPWRADIHHLPWPLQPATGEIHAQSLALAHGIHLPDTSPLLHYARQHRAFMWWLVPA